MSAWRRGDYISHVATYGSEPETDNSGGRTNALNGRPTARRDRVVGVIRAVFRTAGRLCLASNRPSVAC